MTSMPLCLTLTKRENGNSSDFTHPISITEGPVAECYENEAQTIFKYVTGKFLQGILDDGYQTITFRLGNHAQSAMLCPTPQAGRGVRRKIIVRLADDKSVRREAVRFSPLSVSGPPEVSLPIDRNILHCRLVEDSADGGRHILVGFQLLNGGEEIHTQRFRKPFDLTNMDIGDIKIQCNQSIGIPGSDGKQQNLYLGDISNSEFCPCSTCNC